MNWEVAPLLTMPESRRTLRARLRKTLGAEAKVRIELGDPASWILRTAAAAKTDLIVMGSHGRAGLERLFLGSVSEWVVRRAPCPVLTVRGAHRPIKSVLAPVNLTAYSRYGFQYAAAVAAELGATLTVLHVPEAGAGGNPEAMLKLMIDGLPAVIRRRCRPHLQIRQGAPAEEIAKAAPLHDLVVLVAHKKGTLKDAVLGTTAERMLRACAVPVLSLPEPKEIFRFQRWRLPEGAWQREPQPLT